MEGPDGQVKLFMRMPRIKTQGGYYIDLNHAVLLDFVPAPAAGAARGAAARGAMEAAAAAAARTADGASADPEADRKVGQVAAAAAGRSSATARATLAAEPATDTGMRTAAALRPTRRRPTRQRPTPRKRPMQRKWPPPPKRRPPLPAKRPPPKPAAGSAGGSKTPVAPGQGSLVFDRVLVRCFGTFEDENTASQLAWGPLLASAQPSILAKLASSSAGGAPLQAR